MSVTESFFEVPLPATDPKSQALVVTYPNE